MKRFASILCAICAAIMIVGAVSGCAASGAVQSDYLNPGSPKMPAKALESGNWFDLGSSNEDTVSVGEVLNAHGAANGKRYGFLLRTDNSGQAIPCDWAVEVPQTLVSGDEVIGYSIKYSDRIQLLVTPTDRPYDQDSAVARESAANTAGDSKLYHRATVRGCAGAAAAGGTMKWEDGFVYTYPSVVEWQEPSEGDAPFVLYALMGDVPVGQLQAVAVSLTKQ